MKSPLVLVVGATGHVGSQVTKTLLEKGYRVRAMVRQADSEIAGAIGDIEYVVGDLSDRESIRSALNNVQIVVSSANTIIPKGKNLSVSEINSDGYDYLISEAEKVGVKQFIQSSVPVHETESSVPELAGKRVIEQRLFESNIPWTIIRNPAFTDVWLVMSGVIQAMGDDPHATTRRPYGFMKLWQSLTGNLAVKRGILLAPGGGEHGGPFVTTRDVAQMMVATVGHENAHNRIIEAGGPQWVTWNQIAELVGEKAGRKVKTIALPAWFAAAGQLLMRPFMASAANVLGLTKFVASYQPTWDSSPIVEEFGLPPQLTVKDYINRNWAA